MHDSHLEKLRQLQTRLAARIKDLEARERQKSRKHDTRRKVIAGALALHHMEKNPASAFARTLARLLDEYVTKPQERPLFALPPLPETQTEAPPAAPAVAAGRQPANDAVRPRIISLKEHFRTG